MDKTQHLFFVKTPSGNCWLCFSGEHKLYRILRRSKIKSSHNAAAGPYNAQRGKNEIYIYKCRLGRKSVSKSLGLCLEYVYMCCAHTGRLSHCHRHLRQLSVAVAVVVCMWVWLCMCNLTIDKNIYILFLFEPPFARTAREKTDTLDSNMFCASHFFGVCFGFDVYICFAR